MSLIAKLSIAIAIVTVLVLGLAVYALNRGVYIGSVTVIQSMFNDRPDKNRYYQKYCRYLYINGTLFQAAIDGRKNIPDAVPDANGQLAFEDVFVKRPGEFDMNGVCRIFRE